MEHLTAQIAAYLRAPRQHWQVMEEVDSTNTQCKRLALQDAPDGTVVLAHCQTAGRGRMGRSFQSGAGLGVYLSILWRIDMLPERLMVLPALGAVAAGRAIRLVTGITPQIKWPNDLVLRDKKICGILTESVHCGCAPAAVVLGIGINVHHKKEDFAPELRAMASSLEAELGVPVSRAQLAAALMEELDALRREALVSPAQWLGEYRENCLTLGREVQLVAGGNRRKATAMDVDEQYGLVVREADGSLHTVRAGEVSVRGLYGYAL